MTERTVGDEMRRLAERLELSDVTVDDVLRSAEILRAYGITGSASAAFVLRAASRGTLR